MVSVVASIKEYFITEYLPPVLHEKLLSQGWRHFGRLFYRYDDIAHGEEHFRVLPVRLPLRSYKMSKSQRRTVKKNLDLTTVVRPAFIDAEKEKLFYNHRRKFKSDIPDSLLDFLSEKPSSIPTSTKELAVYFNNKLVAVSFFDETVKALSSIYGMYDLRYSARRLGIYTILKEIDYAVRNQKQYYYLGYAYDRASFYDYKKRFTGLQFYNWDGQWLPLDKHSGELTSAV